jgi:hypothetical protein
MNEKVIYPRNNRYEIFSYRGNTMCMDDPNFGIIKTPDGMFDWIRSQDPKDWRDIENLASNPNAAFYLTPELYVFWKLRWAT